MNKPISKPPRAGFASQLMQLTGDLKQTDPNAPFEHRTAVTTPGRLLDYGPKMKEAEEKLAEAKRIRAEAEEKLRAGSFDGEIRIDQIVEKPGRRRMLTDEQFRELKSNLELHPLITPITLGVMPDGRYELIAGHNRVQAYRELGRETIKFILLPDGAMDAELASFYSNLLSPALSDYEKYLGFLRRKEATGLDQAELAKEAGIPASTVSRIFAMDRLSPEVKAVIASNPACIGFNSVSELLNLQSPQTENAMVAALKSLAAGEINQAQAIAQVRASKSLTKTPKEAPKEQVIKVGKRNVCTIGRRNGTVALRFAEEEVAAAFEMKLANWIRTELTKE